MKEMIGNEGNDLTLMLIFLINTVLNIASQKGQRALNRKILMANRCLRI